MSSAVETAPLSGKTILIVEDEAILALDLRFAVEDLGASVVGPCHRLSAALTAAKDGGIDGAILDVDLAGETVFPLADRLWESGVPFIFHTGRYDPGALAERYRGVTICTKPTRAERVAQHLGRAIDDNAPTR